MFNHRFQKTTSISVGSVLCNKVSKSSPSILATQIAPIGALYILLRGWWKGRRKTGQSSRGEWNRKKKRLTTTLLTIHIPTRIVISTLTGGWAADKGKVLLTVLVPWCWFSIRSCSCTGKAGERWLRSWGLYLVFHEVVGKCVQSGGPTVILVALAAVQFPHLKSRLIFSQNWETKYSSGTDLMFFSRLLIASSDHRRCEMKLSEAFAKSSRCWEVLCLGDSCLLC